MAGLDCFIDEGTEITKAVCADKGDISKHAHLLTEGRFYRHFFVNDKIEFSLFANPDEKDREKIIKDFFANASWLSFVRTEGCEVKSHRFSHDLEHVFIYVKEKK